MRKPQALSFVRCILRPTLTDQQWIGLGVLFVSFALRTLLIFRGGQYYFPDEIRYENAKATAGFILNGRLLDALISLMSGVEHIGFRAAAVIPAMLGHVLDNNTPRIPALFLSFFSVLNIYLIWLLARRVSGTDHVAFHAVWLAATNQSLMYFSRHLLPYDISMSFALAGIFFAITKPTKRKNLLISGMLGSLAFITYNGYWPLAGFAILIAVANADRIPIRFFRDGCLICLGVIVPLFILYGISAAAGNDITVAYKDFAGSVTQGDYSEGGILPFIYFWQTEYLAGVAVVLLGVYAVGRTWRGNIWRTLPWLAGAVFVYFCLFIPSVMLERFVVYGRLARQMTPFLVLLAAVGISDLSQRGKRSQIILAIFISVILVQSAWNYRTAWLIQFPREFIYEAATQLPGLRFSPKRMNTGAPSACRTRNYLVQNVKYIFPLPEPLLPIEGRLLKSAPHPINFLPYQYEGYTSEQRVELRALRVAMSVLEVDRREQLSLGPIWSSIKSCFVP